METNMKIKKCNMRIYFFLIFCFFYSCKHSREINKQEESEYTFQIEEGFFKDDLLKVISLFDESDRFNENYFLIDYLYTENYNDTLVELIYGRPYTCYYIKGYMKIKDYNLFLFSDLEDNLLAKEFKIIKPYNECYKHVHERIIDSPPRIQYIVQNGRIISRR